MSPRSDRPAGGSRAGGLTLIEILAALLVLSVVLAGFATLYGTALRHQWDPAFQQQALGIAETYLEEILGQPYTTPVSGTCPTPAGPRGSYGAPCDYNLLPANGCSATSASCPVPGDCPCDRSGQPIDSLPGFVVTATVTPVTLAGSSGLSVRVAVAHAALPGDGVRLETFRTVD